jgi:pyridinium-3,5-biscarboxylic acid mononucleotide synthase
VCPRFYGVRKEKMDSVEEILEAFKSGKVSARKAENLLKLNALAIVGDYARLDYNRFIRRGVPEIVYSQNKTIAQLKGILKRLVEIKVKGDGSGLPIIFSRANEKQANALVETFRENPKWEDWLDIQYFSEANMVTVVSGRYNAKNSVGKVALMAAGTSDITALNESEIVLNLLNCSTKRYNDVGVAALHRLIGPIEEILKYDPDVVIVAAGMEGALPSVVAGLTSIPIVGLPTSVGYGYGKNGEAALMSMLQACSLGVSVVNIDAGVAAGVVAWLITRRSHKIRRSKLGN